jgi:acetyltransferase-like isoleucine patch superfamily enzyme
MMRGISTSAPLRLLSRAVDKVEAKWIAWRTYCRIQNLFPRSRDLSFSLSTQFKHIENISIGDHVMIGPYTTIGAHAPVILEDHVRISQGVLIETASLDLSRSLPYPHVSRPITVKRGAWVGAGAMVLGGVTIGEYAVIAAGAVVTKDVQPHAIVVGASAQTLPDRYAGTHYKA